MNKQEIIKDFLRKIASKGGHAAAKSMTPEAKKNRAKMGAEARERIKKAAINNLIEK